MTIWMQNNLTLEDNTCQAMLTFKKLLSTSSISLANDKSYYFKNIFFFVNAYKINKKHNKESLQYKY